MKSPVASQRQSKQSGLGSYKVVMDDHSILDGEGAYLPTHPTHRGNVLGAVPTGHAFSDRNVRISLGAGHRWLKVDGWCAFLLPKPESLHIFSELMVTDILRMCRSHCDEGTHSDPIRTLSGAREVPTTKHPGAPVFQLDGLQ